MRRGLGCGGDRRGEDGREKGGVDEELGFRKRGDGEDRDRGKQCHCFGLLADRDIVPWSSRQAAAAARVLNCKGQFGSK